MDQLFIVTVTSQVMKDVPFHFSSKEIAETFVTGFHNMLTEKGKGNVSFECDIVSMINNEDDILKILDAAEKLKESKN